VTGVRSIGDVDGDGTTDLCFAAIDTALVISGATGATLRSFTPSPGKTLSGVEGADFDGDGFGDVALGVPYHATGGVTGGGVWVYSGATSQVLWSVLGTVPNERLGESLAFVADLDGDGRDELAIGAPGASVGAGRLRVHSSQTAQVLFERHGPAVGAGLGIGLSVVGDLDGDGRAELALRSSPTGATPAMGTFELLSLPTSTPLFSFQVAGGRDIQDVGDLDGDGVRDLVVGILANAGTPVCTVFSGVSGAVIGSPAIGSSTVILAGSGGTVSRLADLDGDGLAEEYAVCLGSDPEFGQRTIRILKGLQTVATLYSIGYSATSGYQQLLAVTPDMNGDGAAELLTVKSIAAGLARVEMTTLLDPPAQVYCTAKVNSQGCTPAIGASGAASLTGAHALDITATQIVNQRTGLFLWGLAPASTPFAGGTLCIATPLHRTAPQSSGGSASGADCTGALHFTATTPFVWLNGFELGARLHGQFWYRDGAHSDGTFTGLTDAVSFFVCF
jgi:hypothetical protein